MHMCMSLKPDMFALDQEPDNFTVAQRTPLPEDIIGFAGDTVRKPVLHTTYPVLPVPLQPLLSSCVAALRVSSRISFCKPTPSLIQDGEIHASNNLVTVTRSDPIPKVFLNQSDESEEAAKELTIEVATAETTDEAKKVEHTPTKSAAVKLAGTNQKIKKQAATGKQKTAVAPAKKDAPVKRCTVSFPGACVVLATAALFFAVTMALQGNSSMSTGAAEVVTTKSVSSWADASNDQQCGMHDNDNGVRNDFTAASNDHGTAVPPQILPLLLAFGNLPVQSSPPMLLLGSLALASGFRLPENDGGGLEGRGLASDTAEGSTVTYHGGGRVSDIVSPGQVGRCRAPETCAAAALVHDPCRAAQRLECLGR